MMKTIISILFCSVAYMLGSCERTVDIPSSTLAPTILLTADTVAIASGNYVLRAAGQSAYGGAQLRRVDFYKGEEKIGEKRIAPFNLEYKVNESVPDQSLTFYAVLIDEADNQVKSNTVTARVKVLPIRMEAENATLRGVARIANDPETRETSSNQAKVGAIDNADSGIDVTIQVLAAGDYQIRIAAGTGFNGTSHKVFIDDDESTTQIYTIANRGWNVWQTHDLVFPLAVGTRKISIRHQTMYGEIDYLEYAKL
ncbi:hypothetical protein M8998_04110 [Sphingobacterium sp. lm-10]|uniref:hypothetical protein n=1 Tax=Sphingobacterium sp. lm-10 TaxID=2944904 RepID=UPI00201FE03F|nr:hypothetical protein [Sphingobacterium sp. lm-10]MCL7987123.1 hypothetical protein [Sphingobacterium sp. lm-10]